MTLNEILTLLFAILTIFPAVKLLLRYWGRISNNKGKDRDCKTAVFLVFVFILITIVSGMNVAIRIFDLYDGMIAHVLSPIRSLISQLAAFIIVFVFYSIENNER